MGDYWVSSDGGWIIVADCELLATCIFFNDKMSDMPTMAAVVKGRYCTGDNADCARHMVAIALGREAVPVDLYPSQTERAEMYIGRH